MNEDGSTTHQILGKLDRIANGVEDGNKKLDGFFTDLVLWLVKTLVTALIVIALGSKAIDVFQSWANVLNNKALAQESQKPTQPQQ